MLEKLNLSKSEIIILKELQKNENYKKDYASKVIKLLYIFLN